MRAGFLDRLAAKATRTSTVGCGVHTVDYDPFTKRQPTSTQLTLGPDAVQCWSCYPPNWGGKETLEDHGVVGGSGESCHRGRPRLWTLDPGPWTLDPRP